MDNLVSEMGELVRQVVLAVTPEQARVREGEFSLHEHVWHLADLEQHGFAERIRLMLAFDEPHLPDFDGERWARERDYHRLDLWAGLRAFADCRRANLARLTVLSADELLRGGEQEGVGRVSLGELPVRMAEHDRAHLVELADWLAAISPGHVLCDGLRRAASHGARSRAA